MSGRKASGKQLQFRAGAIGFIVMAGFAAIAGASVVPVCIAGLVVGAICYRVVKP